MTLDPECVFCRIIQGDAPCWKLFEDARTMAFMDINPANPGHALVIPKYHAPTLYDLPEEWLAASIIAARRVAIAVRAAFQPEGLNLVQSNGPGAGQHVDHLHWHVLPRRAGDGLLLNWPLVPVADEQIAAAAARIRSHLTVGGE